MLIKQLWLLLLTIWCAIGAPTYCPAANDLVVGYGNAKLINQGWINSGGGSAATKAAFNLLGGSVEFDIDFTNTQAGVNGNIYTISPKSISASGFSQSAYCDGAKKESEKWCVEIDWIESNGNCGGAATLHTIIGPGNGCTAWGCRTHFMYNGRTSYSVKIEYNEMGHMTMYRDGQIIDKTNIKPTPLNSDWATLAAQYSQYGAVIYSSLWQGWVPLEKTCQTEGRIPTTTITVKNLRITGTVVQGPTPRLCNDSPAPTPVPTPTPQPAPQPAPTQNCAAKWQQCGGEGFKGPTCCIAGLQCKSQNKWYSQCL
jgi:hypothetical protein